jgi:hypothetical protein
MIDRAAALQVAREWLTSQIELIPCERPSGAYLAEGEYTFFRIVDNVARGLHLGADRFLAVNLATGRVDDFMAGE